MDERSFVNRMFPPGTRDDRQVALTALSVIKGWSYREVRLPAWLELDAVAAGLAKLEAETCKFISPEGKVLVLLPDPTLGVIALGIPHGPGRLGGRVAYWADAYRSGRDRRWDRVSQVGAERLGPSSPEVDAEILTVALDAILTVGKQDIRVLINDTLLSSSLCDLLPEAEAAAAKEALARGDFVQLERQTQSLPELLEVLRFSGPAANLEKQLDASAIFSRDRSDLRLDPRKGQAMATIRERVARLQRIDALLSGVPFDVEIVVDVSLTREVGYYEGFVFQVLERGTGVFLGGGGRYDALLRAMGQPFGGVGFALHLSALAPSFPAESFEPEEILSAPRDTAADQLREALRLRRQGRSVRLDFLEEVPNGAR